MSAASEMMDRKERPPFVRFERKAIEDPVATREKGHYVAKDVDFAKITPAYSKDIFITPVSEWFAQLKVDMANERIPEQWVEMFHKAYDAWKQGQEMPLNGTAIRGWNVISPAQQETLISMHILTVEDLAGVNDEGIRRIGMGGITLKNKAQAWLAQMQDKGPLTIEMAALKDENARLRADVEALMQAVATLRPDAEKPTITAADLLEPSQEELAVQYKQKYGKAPHPAMNLETLKARVAA